jgi:hypothetical protein
VHTLEDEGEESRYFRALKIWKPVLDNKEKPGISRNNCRGCGEEYEERITEDWIKCDKELRVVA